MPMYSVYCVLIIYHDDYSGSGGSKILFRLGQAQAEEHYISPSFPVIIFPPFTVRRGSLIQLWGLGSLHDLRNVELNDYLIAYSALQTSYPGEGNRWRYDGGKGKEGGCDKKRRKQERTRRGRLWGVDLHLGLLTALSLGMLWYYYKSMFYSRS